MTPRPSAFDIRKLYSKSYFLSPNPLDVGYKDYSAERKPLTQMFCSHLREIEKYQSAGTILDVGCAMGFFLLVARGEGWQVYGVDVSDYAATKAREDFGLDVVTSTLKEARQTQPGWNGLFDVVTMWDLVEHLPDPHGDLVETWHVLRQSGLLFLTVPNIQSPAARLMGKRWYGFRKVKEHLYFFSPATIEKMLAKAGFEVVDTKPAPLCFSLMFFVDKVEQYSAALHRVLRWIAAKTNLAEKPIAFKHLDMLVIARKRAG